MPCWTLQAKLGEKNKFYYDEKLKRWVEEGAEPPAEEAALPPPPTTAAFQNGMNDLSIKDTPKIESLHTSSENKSFISSERSSGIPPIPPSSNQYSAHARMDVCSRYWRLINFSGCYELSFPVGCRRTGHLTNISIFKCLISLACGCWSVFFLLVMLLLVVSQCFK